ncbi:MAG: eL32 family ribosomal protein [Nanoarchaeota archaeon]
METKQNFRKEKPDFIRYTSKNLKKLGKSWRRPRGIHNKVKLKIKGHIKSPSIGYGNKSELKGLYKGQISYKVVSNLSELKNLDTNAVLISSKLGLKKKVQLLNEIKKLNVKVLSIKDIDAYIKNIEEKLKQRKEKKKQIEQKKEEFKKKAEEKSKEKKELTQEEKSELEKQEKKVLEKGL